MLGRERPSRTKPRPAWETLLRALATIGTGGHQDLLKLSRPSFEAYAERHRYQVVVGDGSMPEERAPAWAKVALLRKLVEEYELVLWLDADTVILDPSEDLGAVLSEDSFQGLVRRELDGPNTGVWLLRGGDRAAAFLDAVWNADLHGAEIDWWDNSAVLQLLGWSLESWPPGLVGETEWWVGTQWLPEEWNHLTVWDRDWARGRIHHVAGERHWLRLTQMRADVDWLAGRRVRAGIWRLPWRVVVAARLSRWYPPLKARLGALRT
jgi:hypothetical protein